MKKYTSILLTTMVTLSTTCMEKKREKPAPLNIQVSYIARPADSKLYSMSTLNGLLQPQPLLTHHTTCKQYQFSDVGFDYVPVYVPINTNESNNTNDIELTPIYRPVFITETERSQTEYFDCIAKTQKTVPLTNTEKKELINQLYQATSQLYISNYSDVSIHNHQELGKLIILMNKAKQYSITEDAVGLFTYQQNDSHASRSRSLYFNCLKKYNNAKEELPFNTDDLHINPNLAHALNIPCKYESIEDINDKLKSYPAYTNLINKLKKIMHESHGTLYTCLYSDIQTLFNDYPQYNDVTNFESCYFYVHGLLRQPWCTAYSYNVWPENIYNFLNLVEQIKKIERSSDEKEICHKILNFDPTQTGMGTFLNFIRTNYATAETKNYMALFYTFAEKYNRARGKKITPTYKQYEAYTQQKELDIILPDNFNKTLFAEFVYAFTEFAQLISDVTNLNKISANSLQQYVDQLGLQ